MSLDVRCCTVPEGGLAARQPDATMMDHGALCAYITLVRSLPVQKVGSARSYPLADFARVPP